MALDFKDLTKRMVNMREEMKEAQGLALPQLIETAALEFVDDNFQRQSWEGQKWDDNTRKGTILIKSGALKRSFQASTSATQVKIQTEIKYAWVHNEGVDMMVAIPAHERGEYEMVGSGSFTKKGKEKLLKKKKGVIGVRAHQRRLKLPKRQFSPTEGSPSPTLNRRVDIIIASRVLAIMNDGSK